MKFIKLILFFGLILIITYIGFKYFSEPENSDNDPIEVVTYPEKLTKYAKDDEQSIYIVKFPFVKLDIVHDEDSGSTFESLAEKNDFNLAINGGYFNSDLTHSGLLRIGSQVYTALAPNDRQLTHVVMLYDDRIEFISNATYLELNDNELQSNADFQSGPLIISDNIVQKDLIINSINGNDEARRSVLGYTNNNELFFAIAKQPISLEDFASYLINSSIFANENINAINLDGGSSVALYFSEDTSLNSGSTKVIPTILGIKTLP